MSQKCQSVRGASLDFPLRVTKAVDGDPHIDQPEAAQIGLVPEVAFRWMFTGPSNSGKTNLARWVLDKYYIKSPGKSFFSRIYLFSPTGKLDPVWKDIEGMRPSDRVTELDKLGKDRLKDIFEAGLRRTKAMGKDKAPHECVIFDDAIADVKFLNSKEFLKAFVAGRHGNISCMVMTQSYVKVPRSVRMQITALAMFPSRVTEIERLCEEHGPIHMNKLDFISMVQHAIQKTEEEKYPFFFIDTCQPEESRFRRCLSDFLTPNTTGMSQMNTDQEEDVDPWGDRRGHQAEEDCDHSPPRRQAAAAAEYEAAPRRRASRQNSKGSAGKGAAARR